MTSFIVLVVFVVLVAVALIVLKKNRPGNVDGAWPFYVRKPLSAPEQVLYFRLCKALPENIVLAQVGLSRFLGVKKGNNFQAWMNRINRMSADFVVCAKDSSVLAVVELDDSTHERAHRKQADAKKDKAIAAAGIRIVRWNVKTIPDDSAIRLTFAGRA